MSAMHFTSKELSLGGSRQAGVQIFFDPYFMATLTSTKGVPKSFIAKKPIQSQFIHNIQIFITALPMGFWGFGVLGFWGAAVAGA